MIGLYLLISFAFFLLGSYNLFFLKSYIVAIHSLLVALYFYVIYFEVKGRPFSRYLYLLLVFLFIADGMMNFIWSKASFLGGFFSFLFAYFSWRSYQRLEK
jgi:hypothetical protein